MNYTLSFKALSDPNRIKILELLANKNLCACNILNSLSITQPTLSHHMDILLEANIITKVRKGNKTIYQLNKEMFNELAIYLIVFINKKGDTNMEKENKEICSSNCTCGCQEGKPCTCSDDCQCGENCNCNDKCNCNENCECDDCECENCNCNKEDKKEEAN